MTARRPSRFAYSKNTTRFDSEGSRCEGSLYRPDRTETPPVVVLAPGFAAERRYGLPRFAERFAERGLTAYTFDYRHAGGSEGDPRRLVDPARQVSDLQAAIAHVRRLDGVDASRVALWGTGLGGGHVLLAAAADASVSAVVAQEPMVDGWAVARARPARDGFAALRAGLRDRIQSRFGGPNPVQVVGEPDEFAVLNRPGLRRKFLDLVPVDSDWSNEVPARALLSLARYRPVEFAEHVTCPVMLLAGTDDEVIPVDCVETAADRLVDGTLVRLSMGHFDAFHDAFERAVGHELAFLETALDVDVRLTREHTSSP